MKLRAIGTGSKFCRHPLTPASWLAISGKELTLIGAPWSIVPTLQRYGYEMRDISVIMVLSPLADQTAGLAELANLFRKQKKKPCLAAPAKLIGMIRESLESEVGFFLDECFHLKAVTKVIIKEEYFTESITFVPNFLRPMIPSYGLRLENSKIFISGETKLNEDWLYKEMGSDLILHSCRISKSSVGEAPLLEEIQGLPLYLQSKMWLYGYDVATKEMEQPFPMMYVPPGAWVYDSERRDKLLSKERFIRENSKRQG